MTDLELLLKDTVKSEELAALGVTVKTHGEDIEVLKGQVKILYDEHVPRITQLETIY
jgi:hypothetical protein